MSVGHFDDEFKDRLDRHLTKRPSKQLLIDRNIFRGDKIDPSLQFVVGKLLRNRLQTLLANKLTQRKTIEELLSSNILQEPDKNNESGAKERHRSFIDTRLTHFLSSRPTMKELASAGLIKDTMTWTRCLSTGDIPQARNCHTTTYLDGCIYLLGGCWGGSRVTELLILDTQTHKWSRPMVAGFVPNERYSHSTVHCKKNLIMFGGFSATAKTWMNDIHILDTQFKHTFVPSLGAMGANKKAQSIPMLMWYQAEVIGDPPCARAAHTATIIENKMYVFGGNDGQRMFNDLYVLDIEEMQWTQPIIAGEAPTPRAGHSATAVTDKLIVIFGGGAIGEPSNDLHLLDLERMEWSKPDVSGSPPTARAGHTAVLAWEQKILIFGGGYLNKCYNDCHMFDVATCQWSRPSDSGEIPAPRTGHAAVNANGRMYIFGGGNEHGEVYNDLHILDTLFFRADTYLSKAGSSSMKQTAVRKFSGLSMGSNGSNSQIEVEQQLTEDYTTIGTEKGHYFLNQLDSMTDRVREMLGSVENTIQQRKEQQQTREEQLLAYIKTMERQHHLEIQKLASTVTDLQKIVLADLADLRNDFIACVNADKDEQVGDRPPSEIEDDGSIVRRSKKASLSSLQYQPKETTLLRGNKHVVVNDSSTISKKQRRKQMKRQVKAANKLSTTQGRGRGASRGRKKGGRSQPPKNTIPMTYPHTTATPHVLHYPDQTSPAAPQMIQYAPNSLGIPTIVGTLPSSDPQLSFPHLGLQQGPPVYQ